MGPRGPRGHPQGLTQGAPQRPLPGVSPEASPTGPPAPWTPEPTLKNKKGGPPPNLYIYIYIYVVFLIYPRMRPQGPKLSSPSGALAYS